MTAPTRLALAVEGLQVVATEVEDEEQARTRAAHALVAQVATVLLEAVQGRRTRASLGGVLSPEVDTELACWRTVLPWDRCQVVAHRASPVAPGVVEGSFDLACRGRRETFTLRLERNGRRWMVVHLRPLRDSVAPSWDDASA